MLSVPLQVTVAELPQIPPITLPAEVPCPNCGAPMLASWGATCGKCKPSFASPKTIVLAAADVAGMLSLSLGWLVIMRSPDKSQQGSLVELIDTTIVLTRAGAPVSQGIRQIAFVDDYVSAGHAVIRRAQGRTQDVVFTIEDRKLPSPSANGTFVNERRLAKDEIVPLGDGDIVRVGTTELRFKSLWLPAAPPSVPPPARKGA